MLCIDHRILQGSVIDPRQYIALFHRLPQSRQHRNNFAVLSQSLGHVANELLFIGRQITCVGWQFAECLSETNDNFRRMVNVEQITNAILSLPPDEYRRITAWIAEREQDRWDEQLERDVAAGRLDWLADEALEAHRIIAQG